MAPHPVTVGTTGVQTDIQQRPVRVLVTGFGPFHDRYPVNPSFEIVKLLPPTIRAARGHIEIIPYPHPIRVCYDQVRELVPVIHQQHTSTVDLVLHIGMASGREFYTAELFAHRDGYHKNKDLDGITLPTDHGAKFFGDCPAVMRTSLDFDGLLDGWRSNISILPEGSPAYGADCRSSHDAGNYLCDYIYLNSLAWYGRESAHLEDVRSASRPVLFLHVPAASDPQTLETGRDVTIALVEAMAEVWDQQRQEGIGYLRQAETLALESDAGGATQQVLGV